MASTWTTRGDCAAAASPGARSGQDVVLSDQRAPVVLVQPRELLAQHGGRVEVLRDAGWVMETVDPVYGQV